MPPVDPARSTAKPVHPIDADRRPDLAALSSDFTAQRTSFRASDGASSTGRDVDESRERYAQFAARAADYQLDLHRYWSYVVRSANDGYLCGGGTSGDTSVLSQLNGSLGKTDTKLKKSCAAWEDATSPYADHYDADRIKETGRDLLATLQQAHDNLAARVEKQGRLDKVKKTAFLETVRLGLAGLSEQVGERLAALASGSTVDRVTMSSQTKELLDRTTTDPALEQISAGKGKAQTFQELFEDEKNPDKTAETVAAIRARQIEIGEQLCDKTLSSDARTKLQTEQADLSDKLDLFVGRLKALTKPAAEQSRLQDARDALDRLIRKFPTIKPEERDAAVEQAKQAANALAGVEARHLDPLKAAVAAEIEDSQTRAEEYQESVSDATSDLTDAKDSASYWRSVKSSFLGDVETAGGKSLRTLLTQAFNTKFAEQLTEFRTELEKAAADPVKLQDLAADLVEVTNSYSKRAEIALKTLDPSLAQPLQDSLNAKLAALRESVRKELQFQFDHGAFDRT